MFLNTEKCFVINLSKKILPFISGDFLNNSRLVSKHKSAIKDLRIILNSKLNFTDHYEHTLAKANLALKNIL